jgi:hypothetical protein
MAKHQESLVNLSPVLFNNKSLYHTEITNSINGHRYCNNGCQKKIMEFSTLQDVCTRIYIN